MDISSLGAMRQYDIARKALAPDAGVKAGGQEAKPQAEFSPVAPKAEPSALAEAAKSFSDVLGNVEVTTQAMASGKADAHSVVQAMATAEVALETAVTIRNRVVEAYQELLRMPV